MNQGLYLHAILAIGYGPFFRVFSLPHRQKSMYNHGRYDRRQGCVNQFLMVIVLYNYPNIMEIVHRALPFESR